MTTNQDATEADAAMSPAQEAWFDYRKDYGSWHQPELSQRHSAFIAGYEIAMTDKLALIAAQAKADALAEVTEWEKEADASIRCAANLRESTKRADQQEAYKYEHHATIARNLAARMRETLEGATP